MRFNENMVKWAYYRRFPYDFAKDFYGVRPTFLQKYYFDRFRYESKHAHFVYIRNAKHIHMLAATIVSMLYPDSHFILKENGFYDMVVGLVEPFKNEVLDMNKQYIEFKNGSTINMIDKTAVKFQKWKG